MKGLAALSSVRLARGEKLLSALSGSSVRRNLRLASGLVLFSYITAHLLNHALGIVSLAAAEKVLEYAVEVWYSLPGTGLLYGAAGLHFLLALWAIYERRTFRLPPAELLRIVLGFTLPVILIGHFANTRLAYDMLGLSSDYTRVIANLWVADAQGMQLGLLAPGWVHGCMGLHFAFSRRPLYRRLRFVLFGVALLLPAFSAVGFIAMGRELSTNTAAALAAQDYLGPAHSAARAQIARWHNALLIGYFSLIGAAFAARSLRNLVEHRSKRLIRISYPGRTVRVPRGWSVLEASRGFHLPHASMCGGRARCSTCRVRLTAGEDSCPSAESDEQATLERIGAANDVRLACQLRPLGDIAVVPLVRTGLPVYRPPSNQQNVDREVVVMSCDFLNREELAREEMPQDLLYVLKLYAETLAEAIRAAGGTLTSVGPGGVLALFGLDHEPVRAARDSLQAAAEIARAISDLGSRMGREHHRQLRVAVTIHAGRAALAELGSSDPPAFMAVGEAVDVTNELRKLAAAHDKPFAVSEPVTTAVGVDMAPGEKLVVGSQAGGSIAAVLSEAPPLVPPPARARLSHHHAAWRRLWGG